MRHTCRISRTRGPFPRGIMFFSSLVVFARINGQIPVVVRQLRSASRTDAGVCGGSNYRSATVPSLSKSRAVRRGRAARVSLLARNGL